MSAPVRFLLVAVTGWALVRSVTLGALPGPEAFAVTKAEAAPVPPIVPTQFPPITPVGMDTDQAPAEYPAYPTYPTGPAYAGQAQPPRYLPAPVYYYPASAPSRVVHVPLPPAKPQLAEPEAEPAQFYAPVPQLDQWDLAQVARGNFSGPPRQSTPVPAGIPQFIPKKHLDRLQFSAWAMLRGRPGTGSLASGGTLGGSQAGGRLTYAFDPRIAASLRSSSPIGGARGGEVAAGVRFTPIPSIPFAITAERRQAIGKFSTGRSDFALFAEGGIYQRPIGWDFMLDGYAQAGVVGLRERDLFADGGLAVSRPVWGRFSAGFGVWGGYQPGLYRVDAGPRISMRVRPNISVHVDWRQRLAGTAEPSSGPAVTLGANF
ncbi:hypothetical protein [Sphingomonas daechungensis]|uniref:hypothetical protein n=1 Tax=Sphingomonas daechungensis TaxID=1176646 RepID=UPI0037841E5E